MVETRYEHIVLDDQQMPRIAGTMMKVVELVTSQQAYGWSPDELAFQFPHLTLGQIHSALAYYWDHHTGTIRTSSILRSSGAWRWPTTCSAALPRRRLSPGCGPHAAADARPALLRSPRTEGDRDRTAPAAGRSADRHRRRHREAGRPRLLDRASALERVLFTRDADLLAEGTRRQTENIPFGGVIFAHQLRVPIGACIRDLELIAAVLEPVDLRNQVTILPL